MIVDELVVLLRRTVAFEVDLVEVAVVLVVVGAAVVVVVLVMVEDVDVWVVVSISKDTTLNFVLYPFQCHQSKGPAGGYQGVGEGKVVSIGDSETEKGGMDLAADFTSAGADETSLFFSTIVNNPGWGVTVWIDAVAVFFIAVAGGVEDSVVMRTRSQTKGR